MSSSEEGPAESAAGACEPLACTSCRSRKLKCDRTKPACTRCTKAGAECVYPESRRKPAFKRRNVKELEERLAQVEGFLMNAGKHPSQQPGNHGAGSSTSPSKSSAGGPGNPDLFSGSPQEPVNPQGFPPHKPSFSNSSHSSPPGFGNAPGGELLGLGRSEGLPPMEMIEDLNRIFFEKQQSYIPIVNQARYMRSFYAAPHMRPPMGLQYAIWTLAANGDKTYHQYHEIFYQRARQYLEADELKGNGEYFLTVAHAQAWALIGTDEARCMLFTRAAMSSARGVKLVEMMGLHRLDDPDEEKHPMAPTIAPPQDWAELEERRRVFWGVFCMDSHASISTGWPTLIDMSQVTTRLPASEEAFKSGKKEETSTLRAVFSGGPYSTFAGTVVTCHIFVQLLKHVHRSQPDDNPTDTAQGKFWKRHRELDNTLSSAFMCLPERFRLPRHIRDAPAVHQNLNLHAAVIALHNAAADTVDKYNLPSHMKEISRARCHTAATEIVNIMRMISHIPINFKSPLVAVSLYCAASVFISTAKERPTGCEVENLEFIVQCMEAIGRQHVVTRAYLNHLILDIQHNGIAGSFKTLPSKFNASFGHSIPLLARSSVAAHSKPQPPLPGRLPLGNPQGSIFNPPAHCPSGNWKFSGVTVTTASEKTGGENERDDSAAAGTAGTKRRRISNERTSSASTRAASMFFNPAASMQVDESASNLVPGSEGNLWDGWTSSEGGLGRQQHVKLPHRSGTPSANTPSPSTSNNSGGVVSTPGTTQSGSNLRYSVTEQSPDFFFAGTLAEAVGVVTNTATESNRRGTTTETVTIADHHSTTRMMGGGIINLDAALFHGIDQWENLDAVDPDIFAQVAAAMMQDGGSSGDNNTNNTNNSQDDGFVMPQDDGADVWTQLLSGEGTADGAWDPN